MRTELECERTLSECVEWDGARKSKNDILISAITILKFKRVDSVRLSDVDIVAQEWFAIVWRSLPADDDFVLEVDCSRSRRCFWYSRAQNRHRSAG